MPWSYMQIELVPDDLMIRPMLGPAVTTRDEAHAAVQQLLDDVPALAATADIWHSGAKDDTVYHGVFIWTIIEHDPGPDAQMAAALAWCEDMATTMRTTGLDVQVAHPR